MNTESTIPRLVANEELDGYSSGHILEVTTAITMILSTPQQAADRADAIAMATGQGEEWRFHHTIRAREANPRLRYLLVTNGTRQNEPMRRSPSTMYVVSASAAPTGSSCSRTRHRTPADKPHGSPNRFKAVASPASH